MEQEAKRIFAQLDDDGSGTLEISELRVVLERLYNKFVAAAKLQEVLEAVDGDDDGKIESNSGVLSTVLGSTFSSNLIRPYFYSTFYLSLFSE